MTITNNTFELLLVINVLIFSNELIFLFQDHLYLSLDKCGMWGIFFPNSSCFNVINNCGLVYWTFEDIFLDIR